jgi:hypothetical protein
MSTEKWIAWGALGLLSFIILIVFLCILIVFLCWLGPPDEDQQKPTSSERQSRKNWSIGRLDAGLDQLGSVAAFDAAFEASGKLALVHWCDGNSGELSKTAGALIQRKW